MNIKKTPLYDAHLALNAKMIDFAGWSMPLYYQTQSVEHVTVRESVGMFDVSHMGIVDVTGKQAQDFLSYVLANDIDKIASPGKALYSCLLNDSGGILDDLIVYHLGPCEYRLVINAARTDVDYAWLSQHASHYQVTLQRRPDLALIAIQGQQARPLLAKLFKQAAVIQHLKPFCLVSLSDHEGYTLAATGYTGEDGFELMLPATGAQSFWEILLAAGVTPIGLGARDSLRLEAGFNLYGLDMDETVTPFESNLGWTVSLTPDRSFIGHDALIAQKQAGMRQHLKAITLLDKGMLRAGQTIVDAEGKHLGKITSASHSPLLKQSIGFARVLINTPAHCFVEIRGHRLAVACSKPPLWRKTYSVSV